MTYFTNLFRFKSDKKEAYKNIAFELEAYIMEGQIRRFKRRLDGYKIRDWTSINDQMPPVGIEFLAKAKDGIAICVMKTLPHGKYEINNRDTGTGFYDIIEWMEIPE